MLLAELNVRHTRRHMPTRRVALGDAYLPTSGTAYGAVLLGAVVAEFVGGLDEEQRELVPRCSHDAREGLSVPRIASALPAPDRHRTGSTGRATGSSGAEHGAPQVVLELDRHGRRDPQVIGAVMAAAALPPSGRGVALARHRRRAAPARSLPEGLDGAAPARGRARPRAVRARRGRPGRRNGADLVARRARRSGGGRWRCSACAPGWSVERDDVQRPVPPAGAARAPDHGGDSDGAAERLAELARGARAAARLAAAIAR